MLYKDETQIKNLSMIIEIKVIEINMEIIKSW